jgi:hypothetical protein
MEALKEIANKYEITEENILEIVAGIKVKNPEKPTKRQLEGFEQVCHFLKEGKPINEAIALVVEEAKNGSKEAIASSQLEDGQLEKFIIEQATKAANETLLSLPQVKLEETQRIRNLFISAYRARIAECIQDPEYKRQFIALLEGQDAGKLNLLNSTDLTIDLPSSSSSSS